MPEPLTRQHSLEVPLTVNFRVVLDDGMRRTLKSALLQQIRDEGGVG